MRKITGISIHQGRTLEVRLSRMDQKIPFAGDFRTYPHATPASLRRLEYLLEGAKAKPRVSFSEGGLYVQWRSFKKEKVQSHEMKAKLVLKAEGQRFFKLSSPVWYKDGYCTDYVTVPVGDIIFPCDENYNVLDYDELSFLKPVLREFLDNE